MTDQILHQRAVHRRGAKVRRQGPKKVETTATAGDVASKGAKASAATTTNAAPQPAVPPTTTSVTSSSATTSSTSSTRPIKVAPGTTSSTTTSVLPSTTQTKPSRALVTSTSFVTQHSKAPTTSASASPSSTGSTSTGSIVGGIAGGVVGLVVVIAMVAFFIRRWRRRAATRDEFNPDRFRRSAVLLDDANDEPAFKPRPPSMIERRTAHAPAAPPSAYPYSDADPPTQYGSNQGNFHNYGAAPGQHATSGQYNGSPARYGAPNPFGAPPIPHSSQQYPSSNQGYGPGAAPHGAYGAADLRYLQRQSSQGPHIPQYPAPAQQSSFGPGQIIPAQNIRTQSPHESNDALPNPFASITAIEHSTSATSSRSAGSPPPGNPEKQGAYLTRQPTQTGGAPPAYVVDGSYTEMKRDVKVAPLIVANAVNSEATSSSSSPAMTTSATPEAAPSNTAALKRPLSTYTVYDADDAYGGI